MLCKFITVSFDKVLYETFICHLGERCGISAEDMDYISLDQDSPVSANVWGWVASEDFLIIDIRKVNIALAVVLYARYLRWPQRTFLLLTSEQEKAFDWGYGAGVCDGEGNGSSKKLTRLQRDIAFFLEQSNSGTDRSDEPVRLFLEKYWGNEGFEDKNWDNERLDFDDINDQEKNTGEAITARLKACVSEEDTEGFKKELEGINGNSCIDFMDYIIISNLCKEMDLKMHRVYVVEQGYRIWEGQIPKLTFELIDAYIDSPDRMHRKKALEMAEGYFGITWNREAEIEISPSAANVVVEEDFLKSLFNAYIGLGKFENLSKLIAFEGYFAEIGQINTLNTLFLRNKAICFREKGDYRNALKCFNELYKKDASDNTLNLIAMTYEGAGRAREAARLSLLVLLMNYSDAGSRIRLAEIMVKHSLIFAGEMEWEETTQISRRAERQAVPLVMSVFGIESNQRKQSIVYDIYKLLENMHDEEVRDFLIQNKDKQAYIWRNFNSEFSGNTYDHSLVRHLSLKHDELENGDLKLEQYLEHVMSYSKDGGEIAEYAGDK